MINVVDMTKQDKYVNVNLDEFVQIWTLKGGLISPTVAGELMGVSSPYVTKLMDQGKIEVVEINNRRYITLPEIIKKVKEK